MYRFIFFFITGVGSLSFLWSIVLIIAGLITSVSVVVVVDVIVIVVGRMGIIG